MVPVRAAPLRFRAPMGQPGSAGSCSGEPSAISRGPLRALSSYPRSRASFDAVPGLGQQRDQRRTAGPGGGKVDRGLRPWAASSPWRSGLRPCSGGPRPRSGGRASAAAGLPKCSATRLHRRQDDEQVGVDHLGQLGAGQVLVDDGAGALQVVALPEHRDAAAADRNGQLPGLRPWRARFPFPPRPAAWARPPRGASRGRRLPS